LRGTTILIAEDHTDSREALRWCLDECGATCVESSSGSEALEAFNQRPPHILLADVRMPPVDGLELIRRIRDLPSERGRLTPAIAVSAQANEEQALMAGYHAVIPKPYDPTLVVKMVEEFVGAGAASPSRKASWTVIPDAPGTVVMTFVGHLGVSDAKASTEVLVGYLETEPRKLVVDLRRVTGVSPAAGSVAQRALWTMRHAVRHVHIIGGPSFARVVASATCRLLGLGCTLDGGGPVR
jgi:CheY-like chemotaxis protein